MLRALIVDDENISIDLIKYFCQKSGVIEVAGLAKDGVEASKFLDKNDVDLIFLDIEMPEMDGVELLKSLINPPMVIIVTSRTEHGSFAFEYDVIDYLVKPVEYARFMRAINKAIEEGRTRKLAYEDKNAIYVRSSNKIVRLQYSEILYIEALADYVMFCTEDKKHIVHATMKSLERKLPADIFKRTHRSYFVNISKIETIEDNNIVIQKNQIPVSTSYKEALLRTLNFL